MSVLCVPSESSAVTSLMPVNGVDKGTFSTLLVLGSTSAAFEPTSAARRTPSSVFTKSIVLGSPPTSTRFGSIRNGRSEPSAGAASGKSSTLVSPVRRTASSASTSTPFVVAASWNTTSAGSPCAPC
jgi:hypothetical protein